LQRSKAQGVLVLEVQAEQIDESIDGAGANEDGDRSADQNPITQQRQVQ
jgi:hypothetical protein